MSLLFADPAELQAIAERISRHADAVRAGATMLAGAVANDRWRGIASDVFCAQAGSVTTDMRACAGRLEGAADALRRHAALVQGVFDEIWHRWEGLESAGATVLSDVAGVVDDTLNLFGLG